MTTDTPRTRHHTPACHDRQETPASHDPDRLLTADQVAAILGGSIRRSTVIRSWRRWGLTPRRFGKQLRWKQSDLDDWIEHTRPT